MKDLLWDERMLGVFRASACLTKEEDIVLYDWAHDNNIVETARKCSVSDRTVGRIRKTLRRKYDNIQPYTDLPKRSKQ